MTSAELRKSVPARSPSPPGSRHFLTVFLLATIGCQFANPANSGDYEPGRTPLGALTIGVWLPAGLDEYRFSGADQQRLRDLGINYIEWLQRAQVGELTAEEAAMEFCNRAGVHMPVYYEAPGFSPYDKLHNWATRVSPDEHFDAAVHERIAGLKSRWEGAPGFAGYLIGHEDYSKKYYEALGRTVAAVKAADPLRPAVTVGNIDSYPKLGTFLDAFFPEGAGTANVLQHEHYVFLADVPTHGRELDKALDDLADGYGRVARRLQRRQARWHAIVQVQSETRHGDGFDGALYRKPTPGELRIQVGLALARGAAGVIYFLYSSGIEEVLDEDGEIRQRREYEGIVDRQGAPTDSYFAIQEINKQLRAMSPILEELHFHGGYEARRIPSGVSPVAVTTEAADVGLFGDGTAVSHVLVVNRQANRAQAIHLVPAAGTEITDAITGDLLQTQEGGLSVGIEAGGFRLLAVSTGGE